MTNKCRKFSDGYLKGYADGVIDGSLGLPDMEKFEKGEELNERGK